MSNKAKSRLAPKDDPLESKYFSQPPTTENKIYKEKQFSSAKRIEKLPILIVSAPFWMIIVKILTDLRPEQIKNFLIPNSYLPLTSSVFFAFFFTISYITLNNKISLLVGLLISLVLYLKLINVIFDWYLLLSLIVVFIIIYILLILLFHKKKR